LGLSQAVVAERAGLTQTYLSKIEHAKVDPRISTLQDVARAEGLEIVLVPIELLPAIRSILSGDPKPDGRRLFEVDG
jgi:transcriptional regulator with XRE-family HTH domain